MKKTKTIRSIQCSILLAVSAGPLAAAPYGPQGRETAWVQPDGNSIQLRVFGDEYFARTETSAGYTVIFEEGAYYYARTSADGSSFESTGVLANEQAPADLAKNVALSKAGRKAIRSANLEKYDGERLQRWNQRVKAVSKLNAPGASSLGTAEAAEAGLRAAPVNGNLRGLTIIVQFPDDPETSRADAVTFPTTRAKIVNYCNQVNYTENGNTGSVRDYFADQSLGKLVYTQKVTTIVTMPRPRNYYNYSNYPSNTRLRGDSGRILLRDALGILVQQGYDFSGLTKNASNQVLATNIFFAGQDSGVWSQGLWPHQWTLGGAPFNVGTTANPMYINQYQITNLENSAPVIGTFCHENGHLILDYPDLYDYDGDSQGAGYHCLMGAGSYNNDGKTPSPINAYFKDIVGWANVTDLTTAQFATVTMRSTGNRAYRIRKPDTTNEYFIAENRGNGDKWAAASVDKGIAIWHIDENVVGNDSQEMTEDEHYQVSLEQADGDFDLENNANAGDAQDLFDLATPLFNDDTTPDANWWSGTASGVKIEVLSPTGPSIDVLFGEVPPNTIIVGRPNGGEILYPNSIYNISWKANITGNVKIDLLKGGLPIAVIAASEPNDGSYQWSVPASIVRGNNYSIRISSVSNAIATSDTSDELFSVSTATFPVKGVMPYGWAKPKGASASFVVDPDLKYEGKRSLVTQAIGDGGRAAIAYTSDFKEGAVSFYIKVSTELGFDSAKFFIDGVQQQLGVSDALSGNVDWTFVTIPISAGTHTIMWAYDKDSSYAGLDDKVWIDGVSFPATTQEIAVKDPEGVEVESGKLTRKFADVSMGSKSKSHVFTIRNRGKADLHGLRVLKTGDGAGDFEIVQPKKSAISGGKNTTFEVVFTPKSKGLKKAGIVIKSNDLDEGQFAINLEGNGLGVPKLAVSQPASEPMKDGDSKKFGSAKVGSEGKSRVFTITNSGVVTLKKLDVTKTGLNPRDFKVGKLGATSLEPGASTTFKVTFSPRAQDERSAKIQIASNDKKTGTFDISVSGVGTARKGGKKSSAVLAGTGNGGGGIVEATLGKQTVAEAVSSVEVVSGVKYRSLTVAKVNGEVPGTVEVSSNLLDWYSGKKYTTILVDDAAVLKVRDNTPLEPGTKRYIRLN